LKCQAYSAVATFVKREDGPTAVEYAVIIALVLMVCIGAVVLIGQSSSGALQNASDQGLPSGN